MAGRVITIEQRKGASKTTLAAQLAVAWLEAGTRVAVLDIDPQASLAAWVGLRRARLGDAAIGFAFAAPPGSRVARHLAVQTRQMIPSHPSLDEIASSLRSSQ